MLQAYNSSTKLFCMQKNSLLPKINPVNSYLHDGRWWQGSESAENMEIYK